MRTNARQPSYGLKGCTAAVQAVHTGGVAAVILQCQNGFIQEREVSPMNLQKIEDEALHLSKEERTRLVQRLVLSLEAPSERELRSDWLLEARQRAEELDNGSVQAVPGDDVLRKARALIN